MDYGKMKNKLEDIASRAVASHSPREEEIDAPEAPPEEDLMAMLVDALKEAGGDEESEAVKAILVRMEKAGLNPEQALAEARKEEEDAPADEAAPPIDAEGM